MGPILHLLFEINSTCLHSEYVQKCDALDEKKSVRVKVVENEASLVELSQVG